MYADKHAEPFQMQRWWARCISNGSSKHTAGVGMNDVLGDWALHLCVWNCSVMQKGLCSIEIFLDLEVCVLCVYIPGVEIFYQ